MCQLRNIGGCVGMIIKKGDSVRIGGFAPMSTMERYEGAEGVVVGIEEGRHLGDVIFVQLKYQGQADYIPRIIQTRRQFCHKD